jgi:hypothetical protein
MNNGDSPPNNAVEKGRFPDVGAPYDGDQAWHPKNMKQKLAG